MRTLAHFSDLHLGDSAAQDRVVQHAVDAALAQGVDHVVVTGDLTHGGLRTELARFHALFAPLLRQGRVTVVPGNHDRCGDDVGAELSDGQRVSVHEDEGLYLVRVDSTAPHNDISWRSHGDLCARTLARVDQALSDAPPFALVAVLLHHHVVPLPTESVQEWFADRMGWPHARELQLGAQLLKQARGRCDLVLHGHRHVPRHLEVAGCGTRPLQVFNAGSTSQLGAFRLFRHEDGAMRGPATWQHVGPSPRPSPHTLPRPALALQLA